MSSDESDELLWTTGAGGWIQFRHSALPGPLYVRFVEQPGGRWLPAELYLDGRPEQHTDVRDAETGPAALHLIAKWLKRMSHKVSIETDLHEGWSDSGGEYGPDLSRLASYFGMGIETGSKPGDSWIRDSRKAQQGHLPQPPYAPDPDYSAFHEPLQPPPLPDPSNGMTDDFFRDVERFHAWHIAYGHRDAAQRTARAIGVSIRTVHSWLYRGRQRGVIAAAHSRGRR